MTTVLMPATRYLLAALVVGVTTLVTGCSGTRIKITGDGDANGLIVFDARVDVEVILGLGVSHHVSNATLAPTDQVSERFVSTRCDDLLVFANLPPGTYVLRQVRTVSSVWNSWSPWNYHLPYDQLPKQLFVTIKPGDVHFIGRFTLLEASGFSGFKQRYVYEYDLDSEVGAWQSVLAASIDGNPWRERIQDRIAKLKR